MKHLTLAVATLAASILTATTTPAQDQAPAAAAPKAPAFKVRVLECAEVDALLAHPEKLLVITRIAPPAPKAASTVPAPKSAT